MKLTELWTRYATERYITSQRGSAWHCYIGHVLSIGKIWFSTSRPGKKHWIFCNQTWQAWLRRWDLQTHQIWWRSVTKWRLHVVAKYNGFVTFFSRLFFFFSVSSASPQVAILIWIARLMAQKSCSNWYMVFRFLAKNCFNIRAPESKLPLNVKIPQQSYIFDWKL